MCYAKPNMCGVEGILSRGVSYLCSYTGSAFEKMLNQPGTIKIYMQEYENPSTKYLFDVDTANFFDAYREAFGNG